MSDTPEQSAEQSTRAPRRIGRRVAWGIGLSLTAVTSGVLFYYFNTPRKGVVYTVTSQSQAERRESTKTMTGHNIAFSYPGEFQIKRQTDPKDTKNPIDSYFFTGQGSIAGQHLGIGSEEVRITSLDEYSGVVTRRSQPKDYIEEKRTVHGLPALIFRGTTGEYERTIFLLKDGLLTTIALSGVGGDSVLAGNEFQQIIDSLRWLP